MKKILIQETLYFNKQSWHTVFDMYFDNIDDYFSIDYVNTKTELDEKIIYYDI